MIPILDKWTPYLTNGEVVAEITASKEHSYVHPPKGVVFGQDSEGNMFLNGKPAWIDYKHEHYDFGNEGAWKA